MIMIKKQVIIQAEETVRGNRQALELSRAWWEKIEIELREAKSLPDFLDKLDQALNINDVERLVDVSVQAADVIRRLVLARVHSGRGREIIAESLEELSKLLQGKGYLIAAAAFAAAAARIRGGRPTWWAAQLLEEGRIMAILFRLLREAEKAERKNGRVPDLRDPAWPESRVAARVMAAIRGLALPHAGGVWEYPGWAVDPARLRVILSPPAQKPAGKNTPSSPAPASEPGPESLGARARVKRPAPRDDGAG